MSAEYDKRLEAEIGRELRALPELPAPGTLMPRVLAAIGARAAVAWYRQSWQMWPAPLRVGSLAVAMFVVAAFCFGLWELPKTSLFASALHQTAGWFSGANTLWNAVGALAGTVVLMVKQLGVAFWLGCLVAFGLAWAMCVGVGTACVRLAIPRR